ncbi:MAG: ABC transporter permease [bacterium JZ-2024 1]
MIALELARIWSAIRLAFRLIMSNKLRSFLTLLGIIMGVFSVVVMQGIGFGLKTYVEQQFAELGSNVMFVWSGRLETGSLAQGVREAKPMTREDVLAIQRQAPSVIAVAPVVETSFVLAKAGNRGLRVQVIGVTPEYQRVRNAGVEAGRFVDNGDVIAGRRVVVVGQDIVKKIFRGRTPMGEDLKLNGISYRIVGVLKKKSAGGEGFQSPDAVAIIPISVAQSRFKDSSENYDYISVQAESYDKIIQAEEEVRKALRRVRALKASEPDDFTILNTGDLIQRVGAIISSFNYVFGALAAIALLTGGIGIMNIMLVTVTERTREIGLRKALGAKRRDILYQFLIEAIVLCLNGGAVGATLAYFAIQLIAKIEPLVRAMGKPIFSVYAVILAFSVSVSVGIIFGLGPAIRAARLRPIEALRYE